MKLRIQAQHLQPGDIVGSGERISGITTSSTKFPADKIEIVLTKEGYGTRISYWGKYTMINVERTNGV